MSRLSAWLSDWLSRCMPHLTWHLSLLLFSFQGQCCVAARPRFMSDSSAVTNKAAKVVSLCVELWCCWMLFISNLSKFTFFFILQRPFFPPYNIQAVRIKSTVFILIAFFLVSSATDVYLQCKAGKVCFPTKYIINAISKKPLHMENRPHAQTRHITGLLQLHSPVSV